MARNLAPAIQLDQPADLERQRYELARTRQLARAWAETLPEPRRRDMAALFTRAAIEVYRAQARSHATLSPPFAQPYGHLDKAVAQLAHAVGREAAPLPIGEAVYFLTGLYTTLLASRERGALGAFYTPPALATRLLDMAEEQGIDWTKARVLDPASGGGGVPATCGRAHDCCPSRSRTSVRAPANRRAPARLGAGPLRGRIWTKRDRTPVG